MFEQLPKNDGEIMMFGFWADKPNDGSGLPWPVAVASASPDTDFIEKALAVQAVSKVVTYRGSSISRLTGQMAGSREFTYTDLETGDRARWPEAYTSHYLVLGVVPDPEFVELINRAYSKLPNSEVNTIVPETGKNFR